MYVCTSVSYMYLHVPLSMQSRLLSALALPLPPVLATVMPGGDRCRATTWSPAPLAHRLSPRRSPSLAVAVAVAAVVWLTRRGKCPSHHTMRLSPTHILHPPSRPLPLHLELCQRMPSPYQGKLASWQGG